MLNYESIKNIDVKNYVEAIRPKEIKNYDDLAKTFWFFGEKASGKSALLTALKEGKGLGNKVSKLEPSKEVLNYEIKRHWLFGKEAYGHLLLEDLDTVTEEVEGISEHELKLINIINPEKSKGMKFFVGQKTALENSKAIGFTVDLSNPQYAEAKLYGRMKMLQDHEIPSGISYIIIGTKGDIAAKNSEGEPVRIDEESVKALQKKLDEFGKKLKHEPLENKIEAYINTSAKEGWAGEEFIDENTKQTIEPLGVLINCLINPSLQKIIS